MKNKLKKLALTLSATGALVGSYMVGTKSPDQVSPTQKILNSGKKQFVAYSKSGFGKSNFQAQSKVATLGGSKIKNSLKNINGFSFEGTDEDAKRIGSATTGLGVNDDWVVVEDRLYELDFITGCDRKPTPGPDPNPTPTPAIVPWGVAKVEAPAANQITKGESILICIADTGTDREHPDIVNMLAGGQSYVQGQSSWDDNQNHGTHVAGTVAAQLNDRDVVGVSQSKIWTAKVLDFSGRGFGSWIANGIVGCVNAGALIISMSLGSPASAGPDPLINDAINFAHSKGVKTVCAAGNDGGQVGWPAQGCTYAVTATDINDRLASFSSRGPTADIAAPGVNIPSLRNGGGVVSFSGTSMATPHVSAALALALSVGKTLQADDIGLPKEHQGIGRLNAKKSVQ